MKKLLFTLLILLCFITQAHAKKTYGDIIISDNLISVYDGDTFKINVPDWPPIIGDTISIRVYGIDTPEIRGTKGKEKQLAIEAKQLATKILQSAKVIELRNLRRGKYFRIIADVYVDGVSFSELMIKSGLAKEYYGGKRPKW